MSKVAIQGNASGTGTLTIAAPNTNTDYTLTLPDATGTVQISGNPISGTTGSFSGDLSFNSGYGSTAVAYGCRAWVNIDASSGVPAIRANGNVTSITDNGVGDYTINFTNSMPDANYCVQTMVVRETGGGAGTATTGLSQVYNSTTALATTSARVRCWNTSGTAFDAYNFSASIFR